ncbi:MAG: MauE/DoxX family redox-associated membrane protein [Bacteroidota bacterium]
MQNSYRIEGMTCKGCVSKVQKALSAVPEVEKVQVQLAAPQAQIHSQHPLSLATLQTAIGHYVIQETTIADEQVAAALPEKTWKTYRPLLLIVAYLAGGSLLAQYPFDDFSGRLWMRHFMAGFFLVFSFFKLLNITEFAENYRQYDWIAGRWKGWGLAYPFVELGLGIAYLINWAPFWTNMITIVVLGLSSLGVIQSNWQKRQIRCACLGTVFNLPMSTVTIVEDVTMVFMAAGMLWWTA